MKKRRALKIDKFEIFVTEIPFRFALKHALSESSNVLSLFVKVYCSDGIFGFGEAVPRYYVTKETIASEFSGIQMAAIGLVGKSFKTHRELMAALKKIAPFGAGETALELALLDAGGKYFKKTIPQLFGRNIVRTSLTYSGGILHENPLKALNFALLMRKWGFEQVKVKVGMAHDWINLLITRIIFGRRVRLRVDANAAWEPKEAISRVKKYIKWFGIEAVEQPTGLDYKDDFWSGLKNVKDSVNIKVIADESLTTVQSARKLAKEHACDVFNIRISKHGGIRHALEIADIAKKADIHVQLGAHFGESGILSAAGRIFASMIPDLIYAEGGGAGNFLFEEPFVKNGLKPSKNGKVVIQEVYGLGVDVDENILQKYTHQKEVVDKRTVREYIDAVKNLKG